MNETTTNQPSAGLSRLRIDRSQRPTTAGRGWIILTITVAGVAALSAGAAWWYYQTTGTTIISALAEKTLDVSVTTIPAAAPRAAPVALVATGKIVSDRLVNVATKVSGQIVELLVEQGDAVEAGQVLARVEDDIYRAQRDESAARTAQAEHTVARAAAEEARARAAVDEARAEDALRQRDYQRMRQLNEKGQASAFEFLNSMNLAEASAAALQVAEAAAQSATAALAAARTDVDASRAILRVWQKRLDDCDIRAPLAGVILDRNAEVGDFLAAEGGRGANANAQLVSIADMTRLRVEVDVSERDIGRVSPGQRARITPDADRRAYDAFVMWVDPVGDYARAVVQVKVRIENPGPGLRIDGSAKVEFLAPATASDAAAAAGGNLWAPKAVVKLAPSGDDGLVFTIVAGRAVGHPVRVGARAEKSVEILSGIRPGMQLICDGVDGVSERSPVRVVRTVPYGDL